MTGNNKFLSVGELAERVHLSQQTLRRWDAAGKLKPAVRLGNGTRLYFPEQVRECIELQKKELKYQLSLLEEAESDSAMPD